MDSHPCSHNHGGCSRCGVDPCADRDPGEPPVDGRAFAWSSVATFVPPLALAVTGAFVAGRGAEAQLFGALVGLGTGMAGSVLFTRWIGRARGNHA